MRRALKDALRDILDGWREDLSPGWQAVLTAGPDPEAVDPALMLEAWEPVFPVRRGQVFPGMPKGAHLFRAFDGIEPSGVRVVVLGQDPYPCPAFCTGRAFEAGNVAEWRELEKMFSVSVRTFMQQIVAARTGNPAHARSTADWLPLRRDIEAGRVALEPAGEIADRWVGQGVLLLNSALTLSRFAVAGDPHQLSGHLPLWRPFMAGVLRAVAGNGTVFIGFGGQAAEALAAAGIAGDRVILREHPARGDAVLALPNPFLTANRLLEAAGGEGIAW